MFAPCPHCGFLVALATTRHNPKQRCPRCDELLRAEPAAKPAKPKAKNEAPASAAAQSPEVAAPTPEPAPGAAPAPPVTPPKRGAAESGPKRKSTAARNEPAPVIVGDAPTTDTAPVPPPPPSGDAVAVDAVTADAMDTAAEPAPTFEDSIAAASSIAPAIVRPAPPRRRAAPRGTPSFARIRQPAPARQLNWRGPVAIVVLVLILMLQLLLAQRAELAAQARWRPVVAAVCGALGCELPPWREPIAFTMLGRNVQPKAGMPGVLIVSASFRNDARWPQPWPTIVLSLSDIDGRQVGQRAFAPAEYRDHDSAELVAPGQSAAVQLDVIEPAPRIVAFTFDFR
jgi:hypothetical protein